jgi:hypothetical protein
MGDDATAHDDWDPLAPLVGLVEQLRTDVTALQGRWEALGEELETKRRRLKLAEATVELLQARAEEAAHGEERGAEGGRALRMGVKEEKDASQAGEASGVDKLNPQKQCPKWPSSSWTGSC